MIFIIYYIVSLPYALLAVFSSQSVARFSFFWVSFIYVLLFAFSYKMGVDWIIYEDKFNDLAGGPAHEIGFSLFLSLWKWLGMSYLFFPVVVKLFYILTLVSVLRHFNNYAAACFVSITLLAPLFLNDFLRQLLAAGFVNLAISHLLNNKGVFKSVVLVGISCFFHVSAVFVFPLIILVHYSLLRTVAIGCVLALFIFSLMGVQPIKELLIIAGELGIGGEFYNKVLFYASVDRSPMTVGHIVRLLILFLVFWMSIRSPKLEQDKKFSVIWSCFILMIFYEFFFYDVETLWTRLREYFVFSIPLILFFVLMRAGSIMGFIVCIAYSFYAFSSFVSWEGFQHYSDYRNTLVEVISEDRVYAEQRRNMVERYWNYWSPRGVKN